MQMQDPGYQFAVEVCCDPATAMQHLLLCMFLVLTVSIPGRSQPHSLPLNVSTDWCSFEHLLPLI